jgi:hypothetical protein
MHSHSVFLLSAIALFASSTVSVAASELPTKVVNESGLRGDAQASSAERRFLRVSDLDEEGEERGINALDEFVAKLLGKANTKNLDDVAPKGAIEMVDMRKFDDAVDAKKISAVADAKKLDDTVEAKFAELFKLDDKIRKEVGDGKWMDDLLETVKYTFPQWKSKNFNFAQARSEMRSAGVTDEAAIKAVWSLYQRIV